MWMGIRSCKQADKCECLLFSHRLSADDSKMVSLEMEDLRMAKTQFIRNKFRESYPSGNAIFLD